jgi:hypothetical protein
MKLLTFSVIRSVRVLAMLGGLALSCNALAVTGSTDITAASGISGLFYGYSSVGAMPYGSSSSSTLSDGKTIVAFTNEISPDTLELVIGGFSSNPGSTYITGITASCTNSPTSMLASSATYQYVSATGFAVWYWSRTNRCMLSPHTFYTLSID